MTSCSQNTVTPPASFYILIQSKTTIAFGHEVLKTGKRYFLVLDICVYTNISKQNKTTNSH